MTPTGQRIVNSLSPRQRSTLNLVCTGVTNRQIGERLGIHEQVVKNYMRLILAKAGVNHRAELIIFSFQHGIVPCPCGNQPLPTPLELAGRHVQWPSQE